MDREFARIFARQHGLITRPQMGGNDDIVRHRIATGRWVRVTAGLYRLAGVPVTWHQRAMAACLAAGPGAVVSHRAAAVVFGVSGFRPGPIDITVPPGRGARSPLATVHRSLLLPGDRATKDHLHVTGPARLLRDLAPCISPVLLEEAADDLLCRRLVTLERLLAQPSPRPLRAVLEAWTPGALPGSPAEIDVVRALREAGFGDPVRQFHVPEAHAWVDLAYPERRVAIELDSFRWHAGKSPFASDRARGNRIVAAGWHLLRAVPGDLGPLLAAARALLPAAA